jgi:hypothetical protein
MAFSIRLSEEEKRLAESYAKIHSLSLGEKLSKGRYLRKLKMNTTSLFPMKRIPNMSIAAKRVLLLPNFGMSAVYDV